MKCENCSHIFNTGFICPKCGIDTFVFLKTRGLSIRLYNEGLSLTKENDLSNAIDKLEQSVLFDKHNLQARNLLGLIYCESGKIADALKHWILSSSLSNDNNIATQYMALLQKNAEKMEKYNDATIMYNKALKYLQHGSDDLAIIQLKKSIDTNPNFIDAYNLMILCCIEEQNYKRAQHFVDLVLKKDKKNPYALRYQTQISTVLPNNLLKKVNSTNFTTNLEETVKTVSPKKTDSPPPVPHYQRRKQTNALLEQKTIFSFALGILAATIVIFVLVVPALNETTYANLKELEAQVASYTGETQMTPDEVLGMRTALTSLEEENKLLRSEETKQANIELLQTAVSQLADTNFEECVLTLDKIDTLGFSPEDIEKHTSMKATAYPLAADSFYTKGKSEYLSNNFPDAKGHLESALSYTSNENFIDDAHFYLGKIAQNNGDLGEAKSIFTKILTEFPDSNQLTNVENALVQLTPKS